MNLNAIAAGATRAVTPAVEASLWIGTGQFETAPDGSRTPKYQKYTVTIDAQEATSRDLRQLDGLNVQGVDKVFYVNGALNAVSAIRRKGGDEIYVGGERWLVTAVLEQWPDWCKVAVILQGTTPCP